MKFLDSHPHTSVLKPFFVDYIETYLEKYFNEVVQLVNPKNEIEEKALFFFTKSVNTLKSINLLFKTGDIVSARILMRTIFEMKILTKKMILDKEVFLKYSKAFEHFKAIEALKFALEMAKKGEKLPFFNNEEKLESEIKEREEEITLLGFVPTWNKTSGKPHVVSYFEIKELAVAADAEFEYNSMYKNLCMDTHTSSGHFYKYFVKDSDDNLILNLHPYLHELDLMIGQLIWFIIDFIDDFCLLTNLDPNNLANLQLSKLQRLVYENLPRLMMLGELKKNNIYFKTL
ncbi:DUF5677 domain-containing protein [Peribacillus asahii]|uniref:DUF5677 domain-containing protein n=1 Tax=Peribacillus asahii TaxID=228899 RepID=UPI003813C933